MSTTARARRSWWTCRRPRTDGRRGAAGLRLDHDCRHRDAPPDAVPRTHGPAARAVFGAGTVQWAWGLDHAHDRARRRSSRPMQQATVIRSPTCASSRPRSQAGLSRASASPTPWLRRRSLGYDAGQRAEIEAMEASRLDERHRERTPAAGRVGAVEVSVDGGAELAPGRRPRDVGGDTPARPPSLRSADGARSRPADDSGNLPVPAAGCRAWGRGCSGAAAAPGGSRQAHGPCGSRPAASGSRARASSALRVAPVPRPAPDAAGWLRCDWR